MCMREKEGTENYWENVERKKTFQNHAVISNRFTTDLWVHLAQEDKNNLRLNKIVSISIGINKKKTRY